MDSNAKNNGPKSTADADQPKRRACDECRARKLACSKEADGCSRCKREGIRCNYSLQKQMGRPRKRPRGETEPETEVDNDHQNSSDQRIQLHVPAPFAPPPELGLNSFDFDFTFDPDLAMDLDLSFLDMDNSNNLDFFDLMQTQAPTSLNVPVDEHLSQPNYLWNPDPKGAASVPEGPMDLLAASWPTGSLGSVNIDFNPGPQPAPPPQAPEFSPEGAAALITSSLSPEPQEKTPGLSPDSSGSYTSDPEAHDPEHSSGPTLVATDTSTRPTECQCFSKLYLALDSLQHLPNDFESAMAVTRNASKTAYQTVTCPVCGDPPLDMHFRTEEHSTDYWLRPFQNIMMLGALLPSLSNAYVRILKMVDSEAAKAEAENRKMIFKLEQYGGVWGRAAEEHVTCSVSLHVEGLQLEPVMWRMTARALLKFDVYGYSKVDELAIPGVEDDRPFVQVGLKDIMNMMEERSKRRHELLDNLVAEGKLTIPSNTCYNHPSKRHIEGKPQCMVIIDIAKKSMADLVIP